MNDTNHIRRDLYSVAWVMPKGWGLGCWGSKSYFSKHGHVAYQIEGDDKKNRIQVIFSPEGQTDDLGMESKVKLHRVNYTLSLCVRACILFFTIP